MITAFQISQMIAQQHQATMGLMSGGYAPRPQGLGPTGLEGVAGTEATGARAISGLGGTVIPAAAMGAAMLGGVDPYTLGVGAFKRGAGVTHSLMSRAGWAGAAPAVGGAATGGLAQAGVGGIARGLMGVGMVAGGAYAASQAFNYAAGQMTIGAARRGRLQQYLGNQFGFRGGQARGMNVDEVSQISSEISELARDLDRGVNEVTRNLVTIRGLGLMRKVQNVREFRQVMKDGMQALDAISREFGVSMQQAGDYLGRMRQAGFRGISDQMAMITPLRQAQWATGMTRTQVQSMMQRGAMMARAVGATGWRGAVGMQRALVGLGAAEQAGVISEGMLEEATGAAGPAAYGAFAGVAQAAMARRLSSRFGRYFLAAGAGPEMRRLDPQRMQELLSGAYSMRDIQQMARKAVYGPGRRGMAGRFLMYEEEMRGQAIQMGPRALAGMVRAEMGERIHDYEDPKVNKRLRRAYGMTKRQAEVVLRMARRLDTVFAEEMRQEEMRTMQQARGLPQPTGWRRLRRSIGVAIQRNVNEPLQRLGEDVSLYINRAADGLERAIFGGRPGMRPPLQITRAGAEIITRMGQGGLGGLRQTIMQMRGRGGAFGGPQRERGFESPIDFGAVPWGVAGGVIGGAAGGPPGAVIGSYLGLAVPRAYRAIIGAVGEAAEEDWGSITRFGRGQMQRAGGVAARAAGPDAFTTMMTGDITTGWRFGGFGSRQEALEAMPGAAAMRELLERPMMTTMAGRMRGMRAVFPGLTAPVMAEVASMQPGRGGAFVAGGGTAAARGARFGMGIRAYGLRGYATAGGAAEGLSGGYRDLVRPLTEEHLSGMYRDLMGIGSDTAEWLAQTGGAGIWGGRPPRAGRVSRHREIAEAYAGGGGEGGSALTRAQQAAEMRKIAASTVGVLGIQATSGTPEQRQEALRKLSALASRKGAHPMAAQLVDKLTTGGERERISVRDTLISAMVGPQVEQYGALVRGRMERLNLGAGAIKTLADLGLAGTFAELKGATGVGAIEAAGFGGYIDPAERGRGFQEFFGKFGELSREQQIKAMRTFEGAGYAGAEFTTGMHTMMGVTRAMRGRGGKKPFEGVLTGGRLLRTLRALGGGEVDLKKADLKKIYGMSAEDLQRTLNISGEEAKMLQKRAEDKEITGKEVREVASAVASRRSMQSVLGVGVAETLQKETGVTKGFGTLRGVSGELKKQTGFLKVIATASAGGTKAQEEAARILGDINKNLPGARKPSKDQPKPKK